MNRAKELKYQIWTIIWTVVILILCNIQMPASNGTGFFFEGFDKMVHLGFFFVLTVLLLYGKIRYQHSYRFRSLTIFKIILMTAALGGAIELLQWKIFTYRSAEWWDFTCDMFGVFMAVFSFLLLHKPHQHEKEHQ
ncbi:VanZ family protein [Pedobacter steynii]|uniref:Glycine cleavage system protein H n=1 Tax=Pedobacter steynii TaxID=430522 RepID=A0A1D7QE46_9SPHI|nr:VanZ family protein [Pedobacter steynii]AOM76963.1 glycine cleavage system protein H [Pedobacter steynii]